jgi:predicted RNase H-like HicB family nuclease
MVTAIVGPLWLAGRVGSILETGIEVGNNMASVVSYTAVFEPAEEGGFVVSFPAIPGLATQGETIEDARAMAADCLRAYLESLPKDGEPMPYEAPELPRTEKVEVALKAA